MAKIVTEFDTVEKTLAVSIDGKSIANVVEVSLSKNYYAPEGEEPGYGCSVLTLEDNESEGLRKLTRLVASDSLEGRVIQREQGPTASPLDGFVVASSQSKVERDIAEYFNRG